MRLLDSLEEQGLIERRPCKRDRRARRLHLTAPGERFMKDLNERANILRDEMLEGINDEQLEVALGVFAQIMENAHQLRK